jgi:phenylpropionate dioxygenase-like ring-hydroxylating dioxygenase large terminal subunit
MEAGELVQPDRVHTSLYTNPAIYDAEMERIFERTWVWVGHLSEIPEPGDFKRAQVGRQPVIVVRDRQGEIRVLLNRCRHRAATVCETAKGNASGFTCPYHAWSYGLDGALKGIPLADGYTDVLDRKDYPLVGLKAETYQGLIFASFRHDIEPLNDFLGGAKKWIDLFMKQGGGFPVKVAGEFKFRFPGNWKIQLENTTDAYHFPVVHRSFLSSVDSQTEEMFAFTRRPEPFCEDLGNGHSVMVMIPELVDLADDLDRPIPARFQELADELSRDHPPEDVRRIVRAVGGTGFNLNLFPNLGCSMAFFRVLQPVSVAETEVRHVALGMEGGPEAANRMRLRIHEHFQGPFGFGTPDDAEAWERVQRGAEAGPDLWILVNRGLGREQVLPDGHRRAHATDETGMRAAYAMWKRMMSA